MFLINQNISIIFLVCHQAGLSLYFFFTTIKKLAIPTIISTGHEVDILVSQGQGFHSYSLGQALHG